MNSLEGWDNPKALATTMLVILVLGCLCFLSWNCAPPPCDHDHNIEILEVEQAIVENNHEFLSPPTPHNMMHDDPIGAVYPGARKALDLLREHESLNGTLMVGDGDRARGWLQQHKGHWERGCKELKVDWPYPESTYNLERCERIALANWMCPDARRFLETNDVEELIRRFRLPFAPNRESNGIYLDKVLRGPK